MADNISRMYHVKEKNESIVENLDTILASTFTISSEKSPVSILQELLIRRGITPNYELIQSAGSFESMFRYRVSFSDGEIPKTALGAGRSKQLAKSAAAKALLDKLNDVTIIDNTVHGCLKDIRPETKVELHSSQENVVGNPVGRLQELCVTKNLPAPTYETEKQDGLPHLMQFTIVCNVGKCREVGEGSKKKMAKRLAAHNMWNRLSCPDGSKNREDAVEQNYFLMNRYGDVKDSSVPIISNSYSQKVAHFYKTLNNSTRSKLSDLQCVLLNDPKTQSVKFLEDISNEQYFEVSYVEMEEKTYSGLCQCLVQLSTMPVAVCHGTGTTSHGAKINAALNALEYLKIMTKHF